MSGPASEEIAALHAVHDELVESVRALGYERLTGPSAATEWSVADVLSHLGSGAVISRATLDAALAGEPNPGSDANRAVWARWDAMTPQEQQAGFLEADAELLAAFDALDEDTRGSLRVDLGFLPAPVDVATVARFRLNEAALHAWDVRVALEPTAAVHPAAVPPLLEQQGMMFGFLAKPEDALGGRTLDLAVTTSDPERSLGIHLGEESSLGETPSAPDASLELSAEAFLRLVTGRLGTAYTPPDVRVSGDVDLETLRAVFPGY